MPCIESFAISTTDIRILHTLSTKTLFEFICIEMVQKGGVQKEKDITRWDNAENVTECQKGQGNEGWKKTENFPRIFLCARETSPLFTYSLLFSLWTLVKISPCFAKNHTRRGFSKLSAPCPFPENLSRGYHLRGGWVSCMWIAEESKNSRPMARENLSSQTI